MSERVLRKLPRINYKEYSQTGCKIPISSDSSDTSATRMGSEKVFGQLQGLLFQLGEAVDDFHASKSNSLSFLRQTLKELKEIRVSVFSVNSELQAIKGDAYDANLGATVKKKLDESKIVIGSIQNEINAKEEKPDVSAYQSITKVNPP